ncbi:FmdB family zinc ribbon protein [Streptomyces sp. NPDC000983]|uniref:FmdB family zinc ribbon protein n=1 Tax=Streptomyces sp. NPDC000983 TaxID=3154373 RepID=UPI0033233B4E
MPTYQYQCTECGEGLEAVQKFTDDALTVCPNCDGRLKKVFSAVGIVFKGSGFYRNDSRGSSSSSSPASASKSSASSDSSSSSSSGSSSTASSSSSDSKPSSKGTSTSSTSAA